ncbi:MAG: site-2 protease family protein [Actinomycetota bacterium]
MFRLLGFDVRVESGFIIFMLLIVSINPDEFGVWLAGGIAVFTIVHELGHALAARQAGAEASISLGFLAGYASYTPTRPISNARSAWISFAGPFAHLAVSCSVLLAMGVNPLQRESFEDTAASFALWWAGPAIGLLNLIPVLPLDGGHILSSGVESITPSRGRTIVLWFSIIATIGGAVWMFTSGRPGLSIFVAFLVFSQMRMLQEGKPRPIARSVWDRAAAELERGREGKARRMLDAALRHPQPVATTAPVRLDAAQAAALVDLLDDPLPYGDPANELILAEMLLGLRRHEAAGQYAAECYERRPNALSAIVVARAAGAMNDDATALAWLRAAIDTGTADQAVASAIDRAPEFARLRLDPELRALRTRV